MVSNLSFINVGKLIRFQVKWFVIGELNLAMLMMIGRSHVVKIIMDFFRPLNSK